MGRASRCFCSACPHGNLDRLRAKEPIRFDGTPFGFPGDVVIMAGETEESIALEIANPSTKMFRI